MDDRLPGRHQPHPLLVEFESLQRLGLAVDDHRDITHRTGLCPLTHRDHRHLDLEQLAQPEQQVLEVVALAEVLVQRGQRELGDPTRVDVLQHAQGIPRVLPRRAIGTRDLQAHPARASVDPQAELEIACFTRHDRGPRVGDHALPVPGMHRRNEFLQRRARARRHAVQPAHLVRQREPAVGGLVVPAADVGDRLRALEQQPGVALGRMIW